MKQNPYICFLIVIITTFNAEAQKQNYIWYFGNTPMGMKFDLNSKIPTPINGKYTPFSNEGCSVISNPLTGKLIYYTDGMSAIDANHHVMPNGSGLLGLSSSAQNGWSCLVPGKCNQYYIFSNGAASEVVANGPLYYSIVDMTLPGNGTVLNPMGDLVAGKKNILLQNNNSEALTVISGKTNSLYWLLSYQFNSSLINLYKITSAGITFISTYNTGITISDPRNMRYSISSGKISVVGCIENDPVVVFDFNNATGSFSNPYIIPGTPFTSTYANYYGTYDTEWSPDGSKLYISKYRWYPTTGAGRLYQYNLNTASSPPILIYDIPGDVNYSGKGLKTGPDNKIYWLYASTSNPTQYMGVVNNPNTAGTSCNFDPFGFNLGVTYGNAHKLPEFLIYNNNPPLALNDNITGVCISGTTNLNVLLNDTEPDGDDLTATIIKYPAYGSANLLSDYSISYSPNAGYIGNDTLQYIACDNACFSQCDTAMVVLKICTLPCLNQKPIAENDSLDSCMPEGTAILIFPLENDSDSNSIKISDASAMHGSVVILSDSSIIYNPVPGFDGTDRITYILCDSSSCSSLCDTAFISICVNSVNFFIPNLITRNHDDKNDTFGIVGLYPGSGLKIFSCWGELVFETEDYKNNWSGENLSDGIYYYYLSDPVRNKNWKGWIHLLN